jgi:predicted RNA binding protein YcfA (HicA-like mRNA interferase family)
MSKLDKLRSKLCSRPKDFTWRETLRLLNDFGFKRVKPKGPSQGSHRRFYSETSDRIFMIAEPHPAPYLKDYQVKELLQLLREEGCIDG